MQLRAFFADEGGATAIEYGFLVALIAIATLSGLQALRDGLTHKFGIIAMAMN